MSDLMNIKELLTKVRSKISKDDDGTLVQNEALKNSLEKLNADDMVSSEDIADVSQARVVGSGSILHKEETAATPIPAKSNVSVKKDPTKADEDYYPFQQKEDHIGFLD